jgi:ribosome-associated protein
MTNSSAVSSQELSESVVRGIQEVKGHEILSIDLKNIHNAVCDYFVICHGTSDRQVEALARSVQKTVREETNEDPMHKEGTDNAEWILIDYFNVVVHIFTEEARSFYNIEKLWADADVKEIEYQL